MSNITKLAPYAYLSKRSGSDYAYDLLLLVPVDNNSDTDLSNVTPAKPRGSTRITIDYSTNTNAANALYRYKHWIIDTDNGNYLDVQISGNNDPDLTTLLVFNDADTTPATVSNNKQTFAPYQFIQIESAGNQKYIRPSCIVLFENGYGAQSESIVFSANSCKKTIVPGNNNAPSDPTIFVINQNVKSELTPNQEFTFEGTVAANSNSNTPPRKTKSKALWDV